MDITETSTNDLVYCAWLICCHGVENSTFQKIGVDDLDVYSIKYNGKTYVSFYSNNPFFLLDLRKVQTDNGFIRRGLLHYIKQFYTIKQRLNIDEDPIVFTGHGAGGAIATLFSWFYDVPSHVYAFGSYPMGDVQFCENFTNDLVEKDVIIQRFVSESDVFARFPYNPNEKASPESFMNYSFPGSTVYLGKDPKVLFDPTYVPDCISYTLPKYYYFAIKNLEEHSGPTNSSVLFTQSSVEMDRESK